VVVLTGAGDAFCAGFDLKEFEQALEDPPFGDRLWESSDRYHKTVLQFPLPTIAAVNGPAIAGGFDLAVMCDIRVASRTARFSHPEITFGDVVYSPLHDLVGAAVARDLCFTGRVVDASEALSLRLVSRVVPGERLADVAREVAAQVARVPRELLLRTKAKALRRAGISVGGTLDL
jgi:enoyl-CoA hydratase